LGLHQDERARYAERRALIWDAFRPLIEYLEAQDRSPSVAPISVTLEAFDPDLRHKNAYTNGHDI
jgi:hypothetical protein